MKIKAIAEDGSLLCEVEREMKKLYIESNRLQKQHAVLSNQSPVFVNHYVLKNKYLLTYICAYEGMKGHLFLDHLHSFVHPHLYKNGLFLVTKYVRQLILEEDDDTCCLGELNSTEVVESPVKYVGDAQILETKIVQNIQCCAMFNVRKAKVGDTGSDYESTGLKNNVYITLKDATPLSLNEARALSSVYTQSVMNDTSIKDRAILCLHCSPNAPTFVKDFLLYPEFTSNSDKFVLRLLKVLSQPTESMQSKVKEKVAGRDTDYFAMYDILSGFSSDNDLTSVSQASKKSDTRQLHVMFYWTDIDNVESGAPPHSAKAVIRQKVVVGEPESLAHEVFTELQKLDNFVNFQSQSFLNNSMSPETYEKLGEFKESASDFSYYGNNEVNGIDEDEDVLVDKLMIEFLKDAFNRNDHDFTDKLWLFLNSLHDAEEVLMCLEDILQDIISGRLAPTISPTNETKIAKFIRQFYLAEEEDTKQHYKEKLSEFLSNDVALLNLVAEVGMEKLRKDYYNFFLSKELTTAQDLQRICGAPSANIAGLWKLHFCLEAVCTPSVYLKVSRECETLILQAAIEYFSANNTLHPLQFSLPIMPFQDASNALHVAVENRVPTFWQCSAKSSNRVDLWEQTITAVTNYMKISGIHSEEMSTESTTDLLVEESLYIPFKNKTHLTSE